MKALCLTHVPFEGPAYIADVLKEQNIDVSIMPLYDDAELPDSAAHEIVFVMGGPMGIYDEDKHPWLIKEKRFIESAIKGGQIVIGICLGAQLIADVLGARVYRNQYREIGWYPVERVDGGDRAPLSHLPESFHAFHWHGDTFDIPAGARDLARSEACENQAFIYQGRVLALQFHLESTAESVRVLAENSADELDGSRYVQDLSAIHKIDYIADSNRLMKHIITGMISAYE